MDGIFRIQERRGIVEIRASRSLFLIDTIFPFRLFKLLGFKWIVQGEGIYFERVETRERVVRVIEQR